MNNIESLQFIVPEIILVFFSFVVLMGGVFSRRSNFPAGALAFWGVVISAVVFIKGGAQGLLLFSGLLVCDPFALFFRGVILLIVGTVILLSMGSARLNAQDRGEYYFFLLIVAVSMMLAVSSHNLLMIYLTVESISIVSYVLVGYFRTEMRSSEAGIKYFVFGAVATGVMLYGISLAYGLLGTLDLTLMAQSLSAGPVNPLALSFAFILIFTGFGFKCSLVPFHMWTPDVYEGAPTPIAALLSVGPKAVGFALMLRVFILNLPSVIFPWTFVAGVIAILTMTVGNLTALQQTNIKRLLAYSTIAQAGYIFVGLSVATALGIKATLFYLFVYTVMNLGAFAAVVMITNGVQSDAIEDYAGLYKTDASAALILTVSLLSLAGIPPLAGFLAKFFVLAAAVEERMFAIAIIAVINSVVALYYYIRVIKFMFLREPKREFSAVKSRGLKWTAVALTAANVLFGVWPHPIMNWLTNILHLS